MKEQHKEYLGDAILDFVVREWIVIHKETSFVTHNINSKLTSNAHLAECARVIFKDEDFSHYTNDFKPLADRVEVLVYELYLANGMDFIKEWIYNNIILPHYKNLSGVGVVLRY